MYEWMNLLDDSNKFYHLWNQFVSDCAGVKKNLDNGISWSNNPRKSWPFFFLNRQDFSFDIAVRLSLKTGAEIELIQDAIVMDQIECWSLHHWSREGVIETVGRCEVKSRFFSTALCWHVPSEKPHFLKVGKCKMRSRKDGTPDPIHQNENRKRNWLADLNNLFNCKGWSRRSSGGPLRYHLLPKITRNTVWEPFLKGSERDLFLNRRTIVAKRHGAIFYHL